MFSTEVYRLPASLGEGKAFYFNYWSGERFGKWSLIFFFSEIMGISESSGRRLEILSTVLENRHCVCVCVCVCVKATLVFKRMWEIKESEEWGQLEKPDPHWPWIVNLLKVKGTTIELWEGLDFYFEFSMYFSTSLPWKLIILKKKSFYFNHPYYLNTSHSV